MMIALATLHSALCSFSVPLLGATEACADTNCVIDRVATRIRQRQLAQTSHGSAAPILGIEVGDAERWIVDTRGKGAIYRSESDGSVVKCCGAPGSYFTGTRSENSANGAPSPDVTVAVANVGILLALLEQRLCIASALLQRKLRLRGDVSMLGSVTWLWPSLSDHPSDPATSGMPSRARLRAAAVASCIRRATKKIQAAHTRLAMRCMQAISKPAKAGMRGIHAAARGLQLFIALFRSFTGLRRQKA